MVLIFLDGDAAGIGALLLFLLVFLGIFGLFAVRRMLLIVGQASVVVLERLGRFHKVCTSGLNLLNPLLDKPRRVYWTGMRPGQSIIDLREQFIEPPAQSVITRDNVGVMVDSVVYYQITDPIKAAYEVNDLVGSLITIAGTTLRNVIGDLDLDHALTSRETINNKLRVVLDEASEKWGVKVSRVEIKNIQPPEDVRITMEKQMTAERNRRALVLQAEGEKQANIARAEGEKTAAIARAEGSKQSEILRAEGEAQARLRTAEAEREAIKMVAEAIGSSGNPAQYLIMQRYIEGLTNMARAQNSKVVFMPMETSSVLSSIGAFKEIFANEQPEPGATPVPVPRAPQTRQAAITPANPRQNE
ncbi:MAG TPA: SPFH domain-containing protein [Blastocatellia bacterium]|nr:SPFH domain-containing protein [Blastocatellia bacterium]